MDIRNCKEVHISQDRRFDSAEYISNPSLDTDSENRHVLVSGGEDREEEGRESLKVFVSSEISKTCKSINPHAE